jgi:hypothetical protein
MKVATRDAGVNGTFTKKSPPLAQSGVYKVETRLAPESRKTQSI